jgi:hypothetical protein
MDAAVVRHGTLKQYQQQRKDALVVCDNNRLCEWQLHLQDMARARATLHTARSYTRHHIQRISNVFAYARCRASPAHSASRFPVFAVMFMMQLFPQLAKARVPALLPSMVAAACLRGPELNALPGVPAALWEREQQRRDREASQRAARGGEGQMLPEEKRREQVNDKWREQVLAAVADLKVAQVGLNRESTFSVVITLLCRCSGQVESSCGWQWREQVLVALADLKMVLVRSKQALFVVLSGAAGRTAVVHWQQQVLAAVADLKVAQMGLNGVEAGDDV